MIRIVLISVAVCWLELPQHGTNCLLSVCDWCGSVCVCAWIR